MAGLDTNSKLLLQFNGSNGDVFTEDQAERHNFITFYENTHIDTAIKKFGTSSCLFDGISDHISIRDSADWDIFSTNENGVVWTIDFFVKQQISISTYHYVGQIYDNNNWSAFYYIPGDGIVYNFRKNGTTSSNIRGGDISDTNWHHIMWVIIANGTTKTIGGYIDGTQVVYGTDNNTGSFDCILELGSSVRSPMFYGTYPLDGHLDQLRYQKNNYFSANPNVGLTDTIIVPASEYSGTAPGGGDGGSSIIQPLLFSSSINMILPFDGIDGSNDIIDITSKHTPVAKGTAQLDTAQKKWGSASLLLDGNSDYVDITDNLSDFDIHANTIDDWTLDMQVRRAGLNAHMLQAFITNDQNAYSFSVLDGPGFQYSLYIGNVKKLDLNVGSNPTANIWYHVAVIKVGNEYGLYVDGIQKDYDTINDTLSGINGVHIGASYAPLAYFNGWIDEMKIEKANSFNANPNVGLTDTITVPTEAYSGNLLLSQSVIST